MTYERIILHIIELFITYLDELNTLPHNDFIHGEMTAYVETLEIIQSYLNKKCAILDFDIEERYKI